MPIVILIGRNTASAAEDFLVFLDSIENITLVGEPTFGSTGQPLNFDLPGGGKARVCTKRDYYPDGREFVGYGIQPDVPVRLTPEDILNDLDPVREKGIQILKEKIGVGK
jgi:C-terminal processing protease CtpA/Prc